MDLMRVFRRAETKASSVAVTHVLSPGQPVWSPRDYKQFADESYAKNVIAYQAINRIADAVASVGWLAFRGETELDAHPLLDLIDMPNPRQDGATYLREKVGYYLIAGNGYEEALSIGGAVREMYQLRPDRMSIIAGANGEPEAYVYKTGVAQHRFDVEPDGSCPIRHIKAFNPSDDWYGLSPVQAASYAIDQHTDAQAWLVALLQNSARPSGALVMDKDAPKLSDDQFAALKAQIDNVQSGSRNAGRPMLLEGGMTWQQMGLGPSDMGIVDAKNSAARDIALAFGVPPQLLGIPGDNTYANYAEARLAFWEDTVVPLVQMIGADWTAAYGEADGIEIRPDFDQVPAIVDKRQTLWTMADNATDLTINERRELKGFEPIAGGDVLLVNSSQISLDMAADGFGTGEDEGNEAAIKALAYGGKT